ncbi:MAG: holo-ACP synthase [Proteobacteria bacterium]|nr:holo-ACP synthase [Pseudomonadota bacterium]
MGNGISTGIDIVSIGRIERANVSERFLSRLFTPSEIEYASASAVPHQLYAIFFAAKEATAKALGTGIGRGFGFRDIEIVSNNDTAGCRGSGVALKLHDGAALLLGPRRTFLTVSASGDVAVAKVLIE